MSLKKIILSLAMILAAFSAAYLKPTHKLAEDRKNFVLENIIPHQFGDWVFVDDGARRIVNPQQVEMINKIYSQTVSRTYKNSKGELVMLVIAYGEDQGDNTQVHYPEVCYPSQGFQITASKTQTLRTSLGPIPVKKLVANMSARTEAITYWTTIGDKAVLGGRSAKIEKLKYAFDGVIADGLLFRVSIISDDVASSYVTEGIFINDLIRAIPAETRKVIAGL